MKKYILTIFVSILFFSFFSVGFVNAGTDVLQDDSATAVATFKTLYKTSFKVGYKGSDVKALQRFLKREGYIVGKIDGKYDKRMARIVKDFQDDNELTVVVPSISTYSAPSSGGVGTVVSIHGAGFSKIDVQENKIWFAKAKAFSALPIFTVASDTLINVTIPSMVCPGVETATCSSNFSTPVTAGDYNIYIKGARTISFIFPFRVTVDTTSPPATGTPN